MLATANAAAARRMPRFTVPPYVVRLFAVPQPPLDPALPPTQAETASECNGRGLG
jgi:hypothetical protein